MKRLVLAVMLCLVAVRAQAITKTSTGFYYPTGTSTLGNYAGWLAEPPAYFKGTYHLGKDIRANYDDAVYAIADGTVYYISTHGWDGLCTTNTQTQCCPNDAEYCNVCVIVKHKLMEGNEFLALYGHVHSTLRAGDKVRAGEKIATVGHWPNGDHLHFGVLPTVSLPKKNLGAAPVPVASPYNGFVDPIAYITNHSPAGTTPPPTPAPAPPKVYAAQLTYQSPYVLNLYRGQSATLTLRYMNAGNTTWKGYGYTSNDPDYIELRTCNSAGVAQDSWLFPGSPWGTPQRIGTSTEATIAPPTATQSNYATVTFTVKVPSNKAYGTYYQYFRLHHNSGGDLSPSGSGYDQTSVQINVNRKTKYDFDGDGVSDVWDRTADGRFLIDYADDNLDGWDEAFYGYGGSPDTPCPADYDGDGKCDITVLRNADRKFLIDYAGDGFGSWNELSLGGYGGADDYPCPADYDGDGSDDISVRDADGDWHIDYAANGFGIWDWTGHGYGGASDRPAPADYDGDGKCDFAVLRNADRKFLIDNAANGFGQWDVTTLSGYGGFADYPCPADFDGDGKDDIAILWTSDRTLRIDWSSNQFGGWAYILGGYGGIGDRVMPGDFDGDGRDDIGVYHPASNQVCFDMYAYAGVPAWGSWDYCDNTHATAAPLKMQPVTPEPEPVSLQFNCRVTPNPVQSGAVFQFDLPVRDEVTLSVFDLSGRLVTTVPTASYGPGRHTVSWTNGPKQPSGLYFVRLTSRLHTATVKFAVVP